MSQSTPADTDLAARLRMAMVRTTRRMRQEAGTDLTPSQAASLASIERIKRPTATQVIARLEAAGLVERTADPADGRATLVSATKAGTDLLRRVRSRKNAYLARRMRDLDAADIAALERAADVLERMLEHEDGRA
jgi:DNA-binding MarR family transcriptional regulator